MILFLHNRYRTTGGEERAVEDLMWLVRERMGEPVQLLARDSTGLRRSDAAKALLRGGQRPEKVAAAVRRTGARVVHAHNLHPLLGWRALAAAREAGAKVVLHAHQYRLVCAVGVCFTGGERCTRCHGRNTLPGVLGNCRGSRREAISYAAALSLWQRRIAELADAVIVPSAFAKARLEELGAPLDFERVHVLAPPIRSLVEGEAASEAAATEAAASEAAASEAAGGAARPTQAQTALAGISQALNSQASPANGGYALVVSRLAAEKGVEVAIDACRIAGRPLVVAGDGPERERLMGHANGADVSFLGAVPSEQLPKLRAGAALALVPSRSDETFAIAAAEAMAAGLPVLASNLGALSELLEPCALTPPGDASAMAGAIDRLWGDRGAGERNRRRAMEVCAPESLAASLAAVYESVCARPAA